MKGLALPILFAVATALFWGLYGPALGNARSHAKPPEWSAFKPYVFIGLAYLVWGCLGGFFGMQALGDSYSFTGNHAPAATWGFLAGSLGAFGALTLTLAMVKAHGNAALVMPIVFGGAVSVSALVGVIRLRGQVEINPLLWVGMVAVVVGIVLVARYTPHAGHAKAPAPSTSTAQVASEASTPTPETSP